jgi:hypothetical protein
LSAAGKTTRNGCCFGGCPRLAKTFPPRTANAVWLVAFAAVLFVNFSRKISTPGSLSSTERAWALCAVLHFCTS